MQDVIVTRLKVPELNLYHTFPPSIDVMHEPKIISCVDATVFAVYIVFETIVMAFVQLSLSA